MKINNAETNNPRSNNNSSWKVILVYGSSTQFQARNDEIRQNVRTTYKRLTWYHHYGDVILSAMASQITGVSIVCSTISSGADQRNIKALRHRLLWEESTCGFPSQRDNDAENAFIWWRHHVIKKLQTRRVRRLLRPSDAIWRQRCGSTLVQVMACCLRAPIKPLPEPMLTNHQWGLVAHSWE